MTSSSPTPIVVFASGTGSNFEALLRHPAHQDKYRIVLLVTDRPESPVRKKAEAAEIDVFAFSPKQYASKEQFETEILRECRAREVQLVVLAGYMRLIGSTLLEAFEGRMVNLHPSLLPAFPGKDAIGQAFAAGVPATGVTVHYVDSGMDTGRAIRQVEVPILPGDTLEQLTDRIHAIEHKLLAETVAELASGITTS